MLRGTVYLAEDALLLDKYDALYADMFGKLPPEHDDGTFSARVDTAVERLGGRARSDPNGPPSSSAGTDGYANAAMNEALKVFDRARKSVVRSHLCLTAHALLAQAGTGKLSLPELAKFSKEELGSKTDAAFWEHAETAYIRLSSFWDRVGQLLDFAFFNIRKFDHNGFNGVMDRMHSNVIPMVPQLRGDASWVRLRKFQTSAKDDGLKWLIERRNLIIHSLHLHPLPVSDEIVFQSQFNHLEAAHTEKLKPRSFLEEVQLLQGQLAQASALFNDVLSLVHYSRPKTQAV